MAAQIRYRLTGGASNTSPAASLGGAMSTAAGGIITDNAANNVWDDITGAESAAGDVEYRCLAVQNFGDQTLVGAKIWIDDQGSGVAGSNLAIGLDAAAIGATPTSTSTAADESTAPSPAVTFSTPTTEGAAISIGDIPAGQAKIFWERRTVTAGASAGTDVPSVTVKGDSL
ncbi:MAG TPA: hypothetical protein VN213_06695 [Solirubrobacteraceae bacterium]|nr:hypothetical protein [Solirubrobacteraceae bacterium]